MNVKQFISKFNNHPILFIGAGISRRYLASAPLWDELLQGISEQIWGNSEQYKIIKYQNDDNMLSTAEILEDAYNDLCLNHPNDQMRDVRSQFMAMAEMGRSCSPFKICVANKFANYEINEFKRDEITELKSAVGNVASIITTNYDKFVENELNFKSLIGNDILLSNPYGSVYKIHGCCSEPSSLIITKSDYDKFNSKYELIRSELVSLFIHHPIIFIGYGFGDENIQRIVNTIFQYVEPNTPQAKQVADNFLIIEYKKDEVGINVEDYVVTCEGIQVRLNKVSTDNFTEIYRAIANLKLKASVHDIRRIQQIMLQVSNGEIGVSLDSQLCSDNLSVSPTTISIGVAQNYTNLTVADFRKDYFAKISEHNQSMIMVIDSLQIENSLYFPIFGYLSIKSNLSCAEMRIESQLQKIRVLYVQTKDFVSSHNDIHSIINDTTIPKSNRLKYIIHSMLNRQIGVDILKSYLLNDMNDKTSTDYNKLLVVYDYLQYCPEDKMIDFTLL